MSANGAALSPVDAARQLVLGPELYAKVTKAKLLVVGAGTPLPVTAPPLGLP